MLEFSLHNDVALLRIDDGKANAVSHAFMDSVNDGLDRAERDAKAVVLMGKPGLFSAGFDLKEIQRGPDNAAALVGRGAQLLLRIFEHPQPIVAACTGHAVAAGAFLLLASDTRIGTRGEYSIGLNETAIGMALPEFAHQLTKARLNPAWLTATYIQAQMLSPEDAVSAGFLDSVVDGDALEAQALSAAQTMAELPGPTYAANKRDIRREPIAAIRATIN